MTVDDMHGLKPGDIVSSGGAGEKYRVVSNEDGCATVERIFTEADASRWSIWKVADE